MIPLLCVPETADTVMCMVVVSWVNVGEWQVADVPVTQLVQVQSADSSEVVAVKSKLPKLRPVRVIDAPSNIGTFNRPMLLIGPSYVKMCVVQPTVAPTVANAEESNLLITDVRQVAEVADDHAALAQAACPRSTVALNSYAPNERPLTVTNAPPLVGAFKLARESTGESKLKSCSPVPAVAPIVTVKPCLETSPARERHETDVLELHPAVKQVASIKLPVRVRSRDANERPETVTDVPPERAVFRNTYDSTGASKVKMLGPVPDTAPTVR